MQRRRELKLSKMQKTLDWLRRQELLKRKGLRKRESQPRRQRLRDLKRRD